MKLINDQEVTKTMTFPSSRYEVVQNEFLSDRIQKDLTISGALIKESVFKNVTFSNCVFFGSKMEGTKFINCRFVNCKFQFTNIEACKFISCEFKDNLWNTSPINKSEFKNTAMDAKTLFFLSKYENTLHGCFGTQDKGEGKIAA